MDALLGRRGGVRRDLVSVFGLRLCDAQPIDFRLVHSLIQS